jgi:hypothetical protein
MRKVEALLAESDQEMNSTRARRGAAVAARMALALPLVALLLCAAPARAGDFGLGVVVGQPTGVTAKWRLDAQRALDMAAAWSFTGDGSVQLQTDYLVTIGKGLDYARMGGTALPYWGIGGYMRLGGNTRHTHVQEAPDDSGAGVRAPLGIAYVPKSARALELFAEVAPALDLLPGTDLRFGAGLGLRYFFE